MTKAKQGEAQTKPASSNPPSHIAYHVREIRDGKDFWTRIGSAWAHKDGNGFNLQIDVLPIDGRISLRRPEDKSASQAAGKSPGPQP